jgi:hypothetical protein
MAASFFGIQSLDYHIPSVLSQEKELGRAVGIAEGRSDRFDRPIPPVRRGRASLSVQSAYRHAR